MNREEECKEAIYNIWDKYYEKYAKNAETGENGIAKDVINVHME